MGEIPPSAVLGYPGRVITFQREATEPLLLWINSLDICGSNFSTPAGRFLRLPRSRFSTVPFRLHKPSQGMAGKDGNKQDGKQGIARTGLVSNRAELFGLFVGDRKNSLGEAQKSA